jgi:hypothetical protein
VASCHSLWLPAVRKPGASDAGTCCQEAWGQRRWHMLSGSLGPATLAHAVRKPGASDAGTCCQEAWGQRRWHMLSGSLGPATLAHAVRKPGASDAGTCCQEAWGCQRRWHLLSRSLGLPANCCRCGFLHPVHRTGLFCGDPRQKFPGRVDLLTKPLCCC